LIGALFALIPVAVKATHGFFSAIGHSDPKGQAKQHVTGLVKSAAAQAPYASSFPAWFDSFVETFIDEELAKL